MKRANFQWSLKPFLIFMMIFGIRIEFCKTNSWHINILLAFCTTLSVVCIAGENYAMITEKFGIFRHVIDLYSNSSLEDQKQAFYSCVCPFFGVIIDASLSVGPYAILYMLMMNGSLKEMWFVLNEIQTKFTLQERFHFKVRKECFVGLLIVIFVSV